MRGFIIWVLFAFAAVCRAAAGGEGGGIPVSGDVAAFFWKALFDNGPLGLFLAYMLHRENKRDKLDAQAREAEERRRDAVGERFQQLDERFMGVIEKYASDTVEVQAALREVRGGVRRIAALLSGLPPDDGEGALGETRTFRR